MVQGPTARGGGGGGGLWVSGSVAMGSVFSKAAAAAPSLCTDPRLRGCEKIRPPADEVGPGSGSFGPGGVQARRGPKTVSAAGRTHSGRDHGLRSFGFAGIAPILPAVTRGGGVGSPPMTARPSRKPRRFCSGWPCQIHGKNVMSSFVLRDRSVILPCAGNPTTPKRGEHCFPSAWSWQSASRTKLQGTQK